MSATTLGGIAAPAEECDIPANSDVIPDGKQLDRDFSRTLDPFIALTAVAGATRSRLLDEKPRR